MNECTEADKQGGGGDVYRYIYIYIYLFIYIYIYICKQIQVNVQFVNMCIGFIFQTYTREDSGIEPAPKYMWST